MRLLTLLFVWVVFAPSVNAAELTQDPNLIATSKGQGFGAIYTWTPMLTRVPLDTPYMSFHLEKGEDSAPIAPTVVLSVKSSTPLATECATSGLEIDGTPITPNSTSRVTARLPEGGVLEIRSLAVPIQVFRAFSQQREVRYVICGKRAAITPQEREGARGVIGLFDGSLKIRDESDHPLMRPFAKTHSAGGTAR